MVVVLKHKDFAQLLDSFLLDLVGFVFGNVAVGQVLVEDVVRQVLKVPAQSSLEFSRTK